MNPKIQRREDSDPLAMFRNDAPLGMSAVEAVRMAYADEQNSDLPTKSLGRRGLRRWERTLTFLEHHFPWEMEEVSGQARFFSENRDSVMLFRNGKKPGEETFTVGSLGGATVDLYRTTLQLVLPLDDEYSRPNPSNLLMLLAEREFAQFGGFPLVFINIYIGHIVGVNRASKTLGCSEIIKLGRWKIGDSNDGTVSTLPPSQPISPVISAKQPSARAPQDK